MNILILSVGTRNKIVQYFKKELNGNGLVIATDASPLAPALYDADKFYIVPRIDNEDYFEKIRKICIDNNIRALLSLIDPELSLIAKHKNDFIAIGVTPIISNYDVVELAFNKYLFNLELKKMGFNHIKSYINKNDFYNAIECGEIKYPVFVKPITGSASININKVSSKSEIDLLFDKYNDLIIQEFMEGKEYGIDVYIDLSSGKPVNLFIKEKIKMRAGETDKSVSVNDTGIKKLLLNFFKKFNFLGVLDIDVFKVEDEIFISEVNPRFGGGYPHAYNCGINFPKLVLNNLNGITNQEDWYYEDNVYMLKYNDVKIINNIEEVSE